MYSDELETLPVVGFGQQGALGVDIVSKKVHAYEYNGGLHWLCRRIPEHDYGLDAQLEIVIRDSAGKRHATGRILSLQVKCGRSYFSGDKGDSWYLYVEKPTMAYWHSHSIPVIFIIVDDKTEDAYWVRGDRSWKETKNYFKISVPKKNIFGHLAKKQLDKISLNQTQHDIRLARLENSYAWIQAVDNREPVEVSVTDWVNKTSARKDFHIRYRLLPCQEDHPSYVNTKDEYFEEDEFSTIGYSSVLDALTAVFPWAEAEQIVNDDELYYQYRDETHTYDSEDDIYYQWSEETYDEWRDRQANNEGLIPTECGGGECITYTFGLALSKVGSAYRVLRKYLYASEDK
jgi:hypothetical protein